MRLGMGVLAVALAATFVASPVGVGAQTQVLQAAIAPGPFSPTDTVRISSIDVCLRGASVHTAGNWSVELQLRDDLGQPTGEPFPALGTYTVQVDCVTTYLPQVRIHYNVLTFDVGDGTPPPTTTPPSAGATPVAPAAVPVPGDPDFTG
jgi:hypothetical protein